MSKELTHHQDRMPGLMIAAGVFFALVFTLIFLAIEQAITHWKSKPVRRKPVVPELLNDGVPRRRIGADGRLRIGK
jgi:hypothetical protein